MTHHLAHMAASRSANRRAFAALARMILILPLAALWTAFGLFMIASVAFGWYAAGRLLLDVI